MRNLKLRPTITIVLTVGFLLPVLLVGWLTLIEQRKALHKNLNDYHDRILNILALGIQEPLWSLFPQAGSPLVNAMMTDKRIERITIESDDGIFLENIRNNSNHPAVQSRSKPIFFHGHEIGKVTIVMNYGHLGQAFAAQAKKFLLTLLVPFLLSIILLFFLLRKKVIAPLEILINQSEDLAKTNLEDAFVWSQRDEMGMLGQSLEKTRKSLKTAFTEQENLHNQAVALSRQQEKINAKLQKEIQERTLAENQLKEHRNLLEKKVRERTSELVISNNNLLQEIEERKKAEEERKVIALRLHRAEKMEALGILASGVAHDLNNILAGIVSYPELLLLKIDHTDELYQPLLEIHGAGKRAAAVVADLLTIARSTSTILSLHNLHDLVDEYLVSPEFQQLKRMYPAVKLETVTNARQPVISCSPVHVKKCLMNLITNAFEASTESSKILITTHSEDNCRSLHLDPSKSYTILSVSDSGPGIPAKDLERIFEPFYSTKQLGMSGSGLGLAVVWNTMQEHNGWVSAESSSSGTTFKLYFPESADQNIQTEKEPRKLFRGKGETILVVDDEPLLLRIAERMLTELGYKITTVTSGEKAVDYLLENSVDAVILDMVMEPGMNGRQTYQEILKINPNQKAMIVSGFAMNEDIRAALEMGVSTFLKKPYSMEELSDSLHLTLTVEKHHSDIPKS